MSAARAALPKSAAEWRRELTPAAYRVLREHGTERAGSSALNDEHRPGIFRCAGCAAALFDSYSKFDSGSGWPSFIQPLPGALGTSAERKLFVRRTAVHCAHCGGHLGHVFADGPQPSGERYCINGVALAFEPAAS